MSTKKRRRHEEEEHENSERWLVSYSDMITVLMALFIVLFAISQVDQDKYIALRDSLSAGFNPGSNQISVLEGSEGVQSGLVANTQQQTQESTASLVTADQGLGQQGSNPASAVDDPNVAAAAAELNHLEEIKDSISEALAERGLSDQVTYRITERGLIIGLVANDVFFAAESADLTPTAREVLDTLAGPLGQITENLSVEGNANILATSRYATNWELSADRASKVVRYFIEVHGYDGARLEAVGFGDTRPLVEGSSPEALAANRRVDIVIESNVPEDVRALLPALAGD
jgi:chemotaxis protein MotB